jgi:HSP20 family protein
MFENPFALMRRLSDEMERTFPEFRVHRPFATLPVEKVEWSPIVELVEKPEKLLVRVELPGLTKENVKLEITEELLTLRGERTFEKEEKKEHFIRTERAYGTFFRTIPLPEGVKPELAKAVFRNGILEIEIPLAVKKAVTPRKLEIEGEIPAKTKAA